jgi:hypothetical protein
MSEPTLSFDEVASTLMEHLGHDAASDQSDWLKASDAAVADPPRYRCFHCRDCNVTIFFYAVSDPTPTAAQA